MTNSDREKSLRAHLPDATVDEHTAFRCGWNSALLAAGASEGQAEPIYQVRETRSAGRPWIDTTKEWAEMRAAEGKHEMRVVYTHPSAEIAALRERIAELEERCK